jgi:hypothetical protein
LLGSDAQLLSWLELHKHKATKEPMKKILRVKTVNIHALLAINYTDQTLKM